MPDPRSKPVPHPWLVLIERWCSVLRAQGLTEGTVYLRRAHVSQLARGLAAGTDPAHVTAEEVLEWLGTRGWARGTRRAYRASYRGFFRWLGRAEVAEAFPRVKPEPVMPRPIPEDQLRVGLDGADGRTRLILRLAAELGLRRVEIARIRVEDLARGSDGWTLLVHGKGDKLRLVPMTDSLAATVRLQADVSGWLFPGRWASSGHVSPAWVGKLASRALPGDWTLHKLRHRFATAVHDGTGDLVVVQQLLGHSSLATTQAYVMVNRARMRSAVELVAA